MHVPCRFALRLAYLGTGFAGWQRQPHARTVQETLEDALTKLFRRRLRVTAAGRTDAGVHAAGQVVHFDAPLPIPPAGLVAALNTLLPADVRALAAWRVPAAFDARRDVRCKHYRYRLAWETVLPPWEAQRIWILPRRPNLDALAAALQRFVGTHDFAAFARTGHAGTGRRGTVRQVVSAQLRWRGRCGVVHVVGEGFLRGMVRRMVGSAVEVARGAQPLAWLEALLIDPSVRPPAPTAPAHGLTLEKVAYTSRTPHRQPADGKRRAPC